MAQEEALGSFFEYDHIQLYTRKLETLATYEKMQKTLEEFEKELERCSSPSEEREAWLRISGEKKISEYKQTDQDLVEQLLHAMKYRVVGERSGDETQSYILQSCARGKGIKVIITALTKPMKDDWNGGKFGAMFSRERIEQFISLHNGREGISVLGFKSIRKGTLSNLFARYSEKHPNLVASDGLVKLQNGGNMLEVYAYYQKGSQDADRGTVLRFFEGCESLPGFSTVEANFPSNATPIYFDHWVSNVFDRKLFIRTLKDTLGFEPKVDFNAGVVAAGAAIIESTVVGNNPGEKCVDPIASQAQLYLPINNALSEVGHVHGYLKEIGQGLQHIANRVENLIDLIAKANRHRIATGHGFEFLNIPRSYYGVIDTDYLGCDQGVLDALISAGVCGKSGAVDLDVTEEQIKDALGASVSSKMISRIKDSIYRNMKNLLGDALTEEQYMAIVRNQILVDTQGRDILMQIFTARILFHNMKDEAPFFEYISRICDSTSAEGPRAGCGGFGIRNFLTLFLSIEVSKAMQEKCKAETEEGRKYWGEMVKIFTHQLDVSNPVLTRISNHMIEEADATCEADRIIARRKKQQANDELKQISDEHKAAVENLKKPTAI